jgi:hypothetical protein
MSVDIRPTSFEIASKPGRFLFLDAFIKDRRLVLVSTYYPDVRFDFTQVEVAVDGKRLERFEEVGANEYEPTRAIVYPLDGLPPRARHELSVHYQAQDFVASLAAESGAPRKTFAVATIFKHDFAAISTFYLYYRLQGVERFYLFYNGDLSSVRHRLPDAEGIVYGEWNFQHRIFKRGETFSGELVDPQAARNEHHAQTTLLTMVRHRYLSDCSFLALVDLDEFLTVEGETLRAHLERANLPTLTARCHWAEVRPRWLPRGLWRYRPLRILLALRSRAWRSVQSRLGDKFSLPVLHFSDLANLWANVHGEGGRTKTIYRGDYDGLFGVHMPKPPAQLHISDAMKLFHIVNTGHGRQTRIQPNVAPVSLIFPQGTA